MKNPNWTREETVLALDAYFRIQPRHASRNLDVIKELSALLVTYAAVRGVRGEPTLRNPGGVARKVDKFQAAQAGVPPSEVGGATMEAEIWAGYANARADLVRDAEGIRLSIYEKASIEETTIPVTPSRGPAPWFGSTLHTHEDGDCVVYRLELVGPVEALFPDRELRGSRLLKIGRSNDVGRRLRELNTGFPPGSTLRWRVLSVTPHETGAAAHQAEQEELFALAEKGLTIGGEFAITPLAYHAEPSGLGRGLSAIVAT